MTEPYQQPGEDLRSRHATAVRQPALSLGGSSDGMPALLDTQPLVGALIRPDEAGLPNNAGALSPLYRQLSAAEAYNRACLRRNQRKAQLLRHAGFERGTDVDPDASMPRKGLDGGENWAPVATMPTSPRERDLTNILDSTDLPPDVEPPAEQ